jgi:transcription termination factor Rho
MPLDLIDLRARRIPDLVVAARDLGIDNAASLRKQELIFEIVRRQASPGQGLPGEGVLEILPDGFGFLRSIDVGYLPGVDDIYVSPSQIRRFNLRTGDLLQGQVRAPKEGERYFALIKVESINGRHPEIERDKALIDNMRVVRPHVVVPIGGPGDPLLWAWGLMSPLRLGQRVLLRLSQALEPGPLLGRIAAAFRQQRPGGVVLATLIDVRPEEAGDPLGLEGVELVSSTSEEGPARHIQVADMSLERARRLVEQGKDVLLLIDGLHRFGRAVSASASPGGRLLPGGVDASALPRVRRLFSAGRALGEGGSLTLVALCPHPEDAGSDAALVEHLQEIANAWVSAEGPGQGRPLLDQIGSREGPEGEVGAEIDRSIRRLLLMDPLHLPGRILSVMGEATDEPSLLKLLDKEG